MCVCLYATDYSHVVVGSIFYRLLRITSFSICKWLFLFPFVFLSFSAHLQLQQTENTGRTLQISSGLLFWLRRKLRHNNWRSCCPQSPVSFEAIPACVWNVRWFDVKESTVFGAYKNPRKGTNHQTGVQALRRKVYIDQSAEYSFANDGPQWWRPRLWILWEKLYGRITATAAHQTCSSSPWVTIDLFFSPSLASCLLNFQNF